MWIVENLFLDSLLFLRALPRPFSSLLDIGSGAGVPGIPLKIVCGPVQLTVIESRQRRASFLSAVVRELALSNARVLNVRAESVAGELAGSFDAVVLRSAGDLNHLLPVAVQFISLGGTLVAAGPPSPKPLPIGDWLEVPGLAAGRRRRFAVIHR